MRSEHAWNASRENRLQGMATAGERGFCKSSQNVYRQYSTEILRAGSGSHSFSILLTSHFEAFDPDFLREQGVRRLLTVAEECEPPDSVRQFICGPAPQMNCRSEPSCSRLKWIALRESPYSVLPLKEVIRYGIDCLIRN